MRDFQLFQDGQCRSCIMVFHCALLILLSSGSAMVGNYACLIELRQVLKLATPAGRVVSVAVDRGDRGDSVKKGRLWRSPFVGQPSFGSLFICTTRSLDSEGRTNHPVDGYVPRTIPRSPPPRPSSISSGTG